MVPLLHTVQETYRGPGSVWKVTAPLFWEALLGIKLGHGTPPQLCGFFPKWELEFPEKAGEKQLEGGRLLGVRAGAAPASSTPGPPASSWSRGLIT